jgi:hypothetical protein
VADAAATMVVGVAAVTIEPDDLGEWPRRIRGHFFISARSYLNTVMNS